MDPITLGVLSGFPLVGAGLALYLLGRKSQGTSPTVTVGTNDSNVDCDAACLQFDRRRQERCAAKFAEAAAKSVLDGRRTEYWAAFGIWVTLSGLAIAAIALPFPANFIVSAIITTAALVLLGVVTFLLGQLNVADAAWARATATLTTANTAVIDARNVVISVCPQGLNTPCLAVPDPC